MAYTVGRVSRLARVSVRTLHYYDEVGLLVPSGRSRSGYRLYTERDLRRLQQILFFRELDFPLEEIRQTLDSESFDLRAALVMQRRLITERAAHLDGLIEAVDRALDALATEEPMDAKAMFEGFDPSKYEVEVKEKWGTTDAYRESSARMANYTKEDWSRIRADLKEIQEALASHLGAGHAATDAAVLDLAERHRLHIDRWYYPCPVARHLGLGEMYVADPRFAQSLDAIRSGLAEYLRDAIRANAGRPR
jgi:DNA-binding transcriptional MerR regulator